MTAGGVPLDAEAETSLEKSVIKTELTNVDAKLGSVVVTATTFVAYDFGMRFTLTLKSVVLKSDFDKFAAVLTKVWKTQITGENMFRGRVIDRVPEDVIVNLNRIIFLICTIAYQSLSSTQPAYLNSMLTPARNSQQLRSNSSNPLYIPRVKSKAGIRTFSVAAPTVWNSLLPVLNKKVI